ncbi:hypothetical protein E2320_022121, partial [Naja naja]
KFSFLFQLSIGFEFIQGDQRVYPSSFRINPKEFPQFVSLVRLLLYFQWNWVGFIASDSDNGERFISTLRPMLMEKEICLAFTQMMKHDVSDLEVQKFTLHSKIWDSIEVILSFGESEIVKKFLWIANFYIFHKRRPCEKVWILTSYWKPHANDLRHSWHTLKHLRGSLHLRGHSEGAIGQVWREEMSGRREEKCPRGQAGLLLPIMAELPLMLLLLLFSLLPPIIAKRMQNLCVLPQPYKIQENYYSPGDLIIGGNLHLGLYWELYLLFNKDPYLFSLSYFIGFEYIQGDRRVYSSSFRINPKEFPQYMGLVWMLLYFQWNWVGFIVSENENGERFLSTLRPMLMEKEICLAFTQMVKHDFSHAEVFKFTLLSKLWANVEVILFFAEPDIVETFLLTLNFKPFGQSPCPKVWILTSYWKPYASHLHDRWRALKHLHGSLHFRDHSRNFSKFSNFLLSLDPLNPQGDRILP